MATAPPDTGKYLDRLDALGAYVQARDTETAGPALKPRQLPTQRTSGTQPSGTGRPGPGPNSELEAGS